MNTGTRTLVWHLLNTRMRTLACDHFESGNTDAGLPPFWAWQDGRADGRRAGADPRTPAPFVKGRLFPPDIYGDERTGWRPRDYFLLGGILGIFLRVVYGRCELLRGPSSAAPPASDGYGPGTPQLSSSANFHADTQQFIAGAPELLAAGGRTA